MSADLLSLAFNSLPPGRRLLLAIADGNSDAIRKLIEDEGSYVINAVLQLENRHRALHAACRLNNREIVACLLDAGADPEKMDLFWAYPVHIAVAHGNIPCAMEILERDSKPSADSLVRIQFNTHAETARFVFKLRVIATPLTLEPLPDWCSTLVLSFDEIIDMLDVYLRAGNTISNSQSVQVPISLPNRDGAIAFINQFQRTVQTLQHYARSCIRRNITTNVLYGAKHLPLPHKLQEYLVLR